MAWRAIQDTVGQSVSLASVSHLAERLYWRLLAHSDPWGRLSGHPAKLRARCFPMLKINDEQAGRALQELVGVNRITVYQVDSTAVVQIVEFEPNQPRDIVHRRGVKSRYPASAKDTQTDPELVEQLWGLFTSNNQEIPANNPESGHAPEHSSANDKVPANEHHSGHAPDNVQGEGEERRAKSLRSSPSAVDLGAGDATAKKGGDASRRPRRREETPNMIDINTAAQRLINGNGWDEATSEDAIRDDFERLAHSGKTTGTLNLDSALEHWRDERAKRYPELAAEETAA